MLEINGTTLLFFLSFALFCPLLGKLLWEPITEIKSNRLSELSLKDTESSLIEKELEKMSIGFLEQKNKLRALEQEILSRLDRLIQETREEQLKKIKSLYLKEEKNFKLAFSKELEEKQESLDSSVQKIKEMIFDKIFLI